MAPTRIIIDTDPGVDDVLAMLYAFAVKPEELEVPLISVTYGNTTVENCLRNVVSLFHVIGKEKQWRKEHGKPEGFESLNVCKPVVAVGAEEPLGDQQMNADFFHGIDGLGGIHSSHPHLSPTETWRSMFSTPVERNAPSKTETSAELAEATREHSLFTPSTVPAHKEILRVLRESPPNSVTVIAIGPMTNLALAASEDVETFLRAKEVVVMGGAVDVPGNITPLAEFNTHSDPIAMARILALTSPTPSSIMPPSSSSHRSLLPYPDPLPHGHRLCLALLPLDITTRHRLHESTYSRLTSPLLSAGSPLAAWATAFLAPVFAHAEDGPSALSLHDPLCVWYALTSSSGHAGAHWRLRLDEDIRVETQGQWCRGACVVDRRGVRKRKEGEAKVPGDGQGWFSEADGSKVCRAEDSPGAEVFERVLLETVFGVGG